MSAEVTIIMVRRQKEGLSLKQISLLWLLLLLLLSSERESRLTVSFGEILITYIEIPNLPRVRNIISISSAISQTKTTLGVVCK